MAQKRHLENAPITEAIVDFMFDVAIDDDQVRALGKNEADRKGGWSRSELKNFEATINFAAGETFKQLEAFEGIRLQSSKDGEPGIVIQYRVNRVTTSLVGAYTRWEDLAQASVESATAFCAVSGSHTVKRVGVRFINILKLHGPVSSLLEDAPAAIDPSWVMNDYMGRRVYKDEKGHAISITLGTVQNRSMTQEGPASKALLLDVDVTKECSVELRGEEMSQILDDLRAVKNAVFFGTLRESALEAYV